MAEGFGGRTCLGAPPDDGEIAVFWGQLWTALAEIPKALAQGRPFLHIDNGYVDPARGGPTGYYRLTYCSPSPIFWPDAPRSRIRRTMQPWRQNGRKILVGVPSEHFGRAWGLDMRDWIGTCIRNLRQHTARPAEVRHKKQTVPALAQHLTGAWALYTHSSNVGVDAVLAGIPVFCAPTCPAAPVGNLDLAAIERPAMPDREPWFNSLMAQQYTVDEMRSGLARDYVAAVINQVKRGYEGSHADRLQRPVDPG